MGIDLSIIVVILVAEIIVIPLLRALTAGSTSPAPGLTQVRSAEGPTGRLRRHG